MSREQTAAAVADYGDLVLKVAWRILPDAEETKDVFQETFLQYHRFLARGEIKHPKAWLCRTAQNTAFKRLRQRRREVQVDNAAELGQTEGGKEVEQQLLMQRVRERVAELPESQREVFSLRNFEGWNFAKIAAHVGCSEESARANEYQALKKIRAFLGDDWRTKDHG